MSRLPARIGFWAAAAESLVSLVYIVGLVILITVALPEQSAADLAAYQWTDVTTYARHYADDSVSLTVGLVVQVSALLAGILILIVFLVLHELVDPAWKIMTRIASAFVIMMAVMSSWGYYVQLASVHHVIMGGGDLEGLGQFVEANVSSPGMATLQLAWALFYGLASLFIIPIFGNTRSERWIKAGFLVNGIIGITVGFAYLFGATQILPLAVLGLVGTSFVYPLLALHFYRIAQGPQ
jgi:hypothetical protein